MKRCSPGPAPGEGRLLEVATSCCAICWSWGLTSIVLGLLLSLAYNCPAMAAAVSRHLQAWRVVALGARNPACCLAIIKCNKHSCHLSVWLAALSVPSAPASEAASDSAPSCWECLATRLPEGDGGAEPRQICKQHAGTVRLAAGQHGHVDKELQDSPARIQTPAASG